MQNPAMVESSLYFTKARTERFLRHPDTAVHFQGLGTLLLAPALRPQHRQLPQKEEKPLGLSPSRFQFL